MQKTTKQLQIEMMVEYLNSHPHGRTSKELCGYLGCNIKTIQNYMIDLKDGYLEGVKIINERKGLYRVIDSRTPIDEVAITTEKKIYLKLAVETLENLSDLSQHHDEIVKDLKLGSLSIPYYIKSEDYQKLNTDAEEVGKLEDAINYDHIIEFEFNGDRYHVEPYRLVNFDGIWYLYGKDIEEKESNSCKTWMLSDINKVEIDHLSTHDTPDQEIDKDLDNAYSAEFVVDKSFKVKLKVSAKIAKLFRQKNHLPRQNSTIQEDGSLLVTSTISTYADIDPEVKSWLPHIEILEPKEYRDSFRKELIEYMKVYGD